MLDRHLKFIVIILIFLGMLYLQIIDPAKVEIWIDTFINNVKVNL